MYASVLIESLCIKEDWIDDTIEIRIIILVEIFVGIKKHCEKKNTHRINEYQDSNDSTSTTPRNARCTFRDHKSYFVFKKIKSNPSLGRLTASSGKIIVSKFCFSFLDTTFIHFERLLCPSLSRDTRPLDSCCISFKILFPYLAYILLDISCIYFVYVAPRKIFSHP